MEYETIEKNLLTLKMIENLIKYEIILHAYFDIPCSIDMKNPLELFAWSGGLKRWRQ